VHLIPGVVVGPPARAVSVGADLLDGVAVVAVDPDPGRGPAPLAPAAGCCGLCPGADYVGRVRPGDGVAGPVGAGPVADLVLDVAGMGARQGARDGQREGGDPRQRDHPDLDPPANDAGRLGPGRAGVIGTNPRSSIRD